MIDFLQRHFKSLDDLATAFVLLAFALFGLGSYLALATLANAGLGAFGAAIITWGASALQNRELRIFQRGIRISSRLDELFARVWGVLFILGGMALLGYGVLSALNPHTSQFARIQQFFNTPQGTGVILFVVGCVGILYALSLIFVSRVQDPHAFIRFLKSLPGRMIGLFLLLLFGALVAGGLALVFAPNLLPALARIIFQRMGLE